MTDAATRGAPVRIRRALLSVSDKTGLVEQAQKLAAKGVELVSTGGTSKLLKEAGLDVKDVADLTGFPEMMDGRVKTLHPAVHGGLLYLRDNPSHVKDAETHGIGAIDLIYVNLYPFEATVASGADFDTCIENIDIGGPAMLRAAAKNGAFVAVCTDGFDVDVFDACPRTDLSRCIGRDHAQLSLGCCKCRFDIEPLLDTVAIIENGHEFRRRKRTTVKVRFGNMAGHQRFPVRLTVLGTNAPCQFGR